MKTYMAQPYGCEVYLYTDATEWKRDNRSSVKGCAGLTQWSSNGIAMFVGDNDLSTLVHECTHACIFILGYVGINPMDSNGEVMAYLMDSMFAAFKEEVYGG